MTMENVVDTRDRIREQAKNLFMKYGIRSVSMDDIAVGLGISKKTIYQWYKDKDELVDAIIGDDIEDIKKDCYECEVQATNAVEEVFLTMDRIVIHMQSMNPNILYDLHKFHFQSFKRFMDHKNIYLMEVVSKNLRRGMEEGLYKADLNVTVLAKYRLESMMVMFNQDVFPATEFNLVEVSKVLLENFLFGLVSPKGYDLAVQYQQERIIKSKQK
jgi:TetR/AcrR family transcriptional regulator, cholesterol catabolism regulator